MRHLGISALAVLALACSGGSVGGDDNDNTNATAGAGNSVSNGGQTGGVGNPAGGTGPQGQGGSNAEGGNPSRPPGFMLSCNQANLGSPALRLLTRVELENTLNDVFPELKGSWSSSLPASTVSAYGFDNDVDNRVGNQFASALLETAEAVGAAVASKAQSLLPCASSSPDAACAGQFIDKYGKRLFRRALTAAERERYVGLFEATLAKSDFSTALKWVTAGLIQSPHTVYRREIGQPQGDGTRQLTPHEIATQLAYTFTGSAPSQELLDKADSGNLGDLTEIARSMLNTPAGKQALHRFFEAYTGYARASAIQRPLNDNGATFSSVNAELTAETRAFVEDVLYQKQAGLKELLTAPAPTPTGKLAQYYGSGERGIGILGLGAFLSTHANADASSPTQRGHFIYLRLLCGSKLEVPPNVPQITPPVPGQITTRQRYEEMHVKAGAACAACHRLFDPIGFGFEHYDEGGRYRQTEGNLPIDAAAKVIGPDGTELFSFDGQHELMTRLAESPVTQQCFSAHLATYAFGTNEACLGASSVADSLSGSIGIVEAFARLAAEPHFTKRKAQ